MTRLHLIANRFVITLLALAAASGQAAMAQCGCCCCCGGAGRLFVEIKTIETEVKKIKVTSGTFGKDVVGSNIKIEISDDAGKTWTVNGGATEVNTSKYTWKGETKNDVKAGKWKVRASYLIPGTKTTIYSSVFDVDVPKGCGCSPSSCPPDCNPPGQVDVLPLPDTNDQGSRKPQGRDERSAPPALLEGR